MKTLIVLLGSLVAVLSSCGRAGEAGGGSIYRLPWPDSAGEIRLQDVELRTLSNPEKLSGATARILVEPGEGAGGITGASPVARYVRTSEGVSIPADYVSLVGATVYAHQERLRELDAQVGAENVLEWPLSLGIEVRISGKDGLVKNNAIFDQRLNSLLLVPYTADLLPPSLSPGILAHEHFHFLFQKIVLSRTPDRGAQSGCSGAVAATHQGEVAELPAGSTSAAEVSPRAFNNYLLRSMNEGFADYWGWMYSRDDHFISKSLPQENDRRRLDWGPGRLKDLYKIREDLIDPENPEKLISDDARAQSSYYLGTQYARFLRKFVRDLVKSGVAEDEARLIVARALIKSLDDLAAEVSLKYSTEYLSPNVVMKSLILNLPSVSRASCDSVEWFRAVEEKYEKPKRCAEVKP